MIQRKEARHTASESEKETENRPLSLERNNEMSLLIADTTREERERIVAESIGNISGLCDGCSPGIVEMYQDYIDGRKELRQINAEFRTAYTSGAQGPERGGCGMEELNG